jgi:hypothetical protein
MLKVLAVLLLSGQTVYTDDPQFKSRWFKVEAPQKAMVFDGRQFASQDAPRPSGDWEVTYAHYDKLGRISLLSPSALIGPQCDNFEYGINFAGTDRLNPATGVQVFERRAGTAAWTPAATEASVSWVVKPGSTFADGDDWLFSMFHRGVATNKEKFNGTPTAYWTTSTENKPSRAPDVRVYSLPNDGVELAYSNVCCNGETILSPAVVCPLDSNRPRTHHNRIKVRRADRYYPGVLGYYFYMRKIGETQWHRQPVPWSSWGPYNVNRPTEEFLWPATMDRFQILNFHRTGLTPVPVAAPQSYANELQLALWSTAAPTVVVRGTLSPIRCPLHLEYFGNWLPSPWVKSLGFFFTTLEGPGLGIAQKHNRTIKVEYDGSIALTTTRSCPDGIVSPSIYWEALIVESQFSRVSGLHITHEGGRAGLAAHDWSGGQAFGPTFDNCRFIVNNQHYPSWGLWQNVTNTGKTEDGNHSLSELKAINCHFMGTTAVKIAGIQSVNFEFIDCHIGSDWRAGPSHSCGFYLANGSNTTCRNSLKYGGGRSFITNAFRSHLHVESLWIDEDIATLAEGRTYCQGVLSIKGNKVNHVGNTDFNLLSLPCGGVDQMEVRCDNLASQFNKPDLESVVFSQSYGRGIVRSDRGSGGLFAERIGIRTPTLDQWKQWGYYYQPNWDNGADITKRPAGVTYGVGGVGELQVKPRVIIP